LIDIDDFWEVCYGSMTVNPTNFSDLQTLTTDLKQKGFVVGMWVHPFVNKNCQPYYDDAKSKNILVKSRSGSLDTSWWNSGTNEAAHYDFTNPDGKAWFKSKLEFIRSNFGIDVFKFDAGETSWYPEDPVLQGDSALSPSQITRAFVNMASEFGNLLETRTGWGSQHLPHLVRMLDFDSRWTVFNGLKSLIPTLIQFNLNGYVFVLPDMIGGNQYGNDVITKELFIRWLQASVFMPSLQFSVAPWDFKDKETIEISLKYTKLHFEYSELILERFKLAVEEGHPGK
jgi:myogenesis-regulating glycosidase